MLATDKRPILLSGDSGAAVRSAAGALSEWLAARPEADLDAVARALVAGPARRHRAVVLGAGPEEVLDGLDALTRGAPHGAVVSGEAGTGEVAFVVPGLGSQWPGMVAALTAASDVTRESMQACTTALEPHVEWPLTEPVPGEERPDWHETALAWSMLFAIPITLGRLWQSFGVEPRSIVGHSIGEIPAAFMAGGMTLEEAAMTSTQLGDALKAIPRDGVMAVVALPAEELERRLAGREGVELSARMSPRICGVGGDAAAVRKLLAELKAEGTVASELDLAFRAIHTSHVDLVRDDVVRRLASLQPRSGSLPFYSSFAGSRVETSELDAEYWAAMSRRPVLFEQGVAAAIEDGSRFFVELSPSPIMAIPIQEVGLREGVVVFSTLRKGEGGADRFLHALAEAQVNGVEVDWSPLFGAAEPVELPSAVLEGVAAMAGAGAGTAGAPADVDAAELHATASRLIAQQLAAALGVEPEEIDHELPFTDLGVDSARATELCAALSAQLGVRVPPSAAFDFPTVSALARFACVEAGEGSANGAGPVSCHVFDDEPIAIVGMSCRYPGDVASPQELWELVAAGRDAISGFPENRGWDLETLFHPDPDNPGTSYVKEGGFLHDAGEFDAEFFGISPREALAMDPQQRLLLEAAWEAIEDGGVDPTDLDGAEVAIFTGISTQDYSAATRFSGLVEEELEGYLVTGAPTSVVSGRIAYVLGLRGPTMTVDTACSSSLVAIHLACQALRAGECAGAIAGGATVLGTPTVFTEFCRLRGIAADGRCKSFAEGADGAGFSEGVGMVVLERLSEAERNGHRILATIRGSAVNQDGASNGLTAPNGPAQERLIRQALANAGLAAADVDAVEAHGTGTSLGDPIEAGALLATYGQEREEPLKLGSLKSNVGHAQAAAGVGGVIKSVMALREGLLPQTLHVDAPSSKIEWESGKVELLREPCPWQRNGHPRRIGVSAFGISGTNAHLILEEAPQAQEREQPEIEAEPPLPGPVPLAISAKTREALAEQAARVASHLRSDSQLELRDVAYSLAATRSSFEHRAVCVGEKAEELLAGLDALAAGDPHDGLILGSARAERDPVFLFAGQGPQHARMAAELLEGSSFFASQIEACEQALSPHVDWSLTEVLREEQGAWLDRLDVVQPALFAVMASLARLWQACGARPSLVAGHSQGEIAAAHIAGALSLEDAALVVAARSKAMAKIAGKGAMASVSLPASELEALLGPYGERLSLAAINGPASQAVSGEPDGIEELLAHCESNGIRAQRIAVDYAAHSAQIDQLREQLLDAFAPIAPRSSEVPFHSTVSGERIDTAGLGPRYWFENLRRTVLMGPVLSQLIEQGRSAFLEISPHPILSFGLEEAAAAADTEVAAVCSLRREEGGALRFARSLAEAKAQGVRVDPEALFPGARTVPLPTYPFQRKRYWLQSAGGAGDLGAVGLADAPPSGNGPQAAPLAAKIAEVPAAEREEVALAFVRGQAMAALGRGTESELDPERNLVEHGFESVRILELRNRLGAATGKLLPLSAFTDGQSVREIAAQMLAQAEAADDHGAAANGTSRASGLGAFLEQAVQEGKQAAFLEMLGLAADMHPQQALDGLAPPRVVRLAEGSEEPALVLIPSLLATSGPHEYARLADQFRGEREVFAVAVPGFAPEEPLPLDLDAGAAAIAVAIAADLRGREFVLAGHSSGGWLAHAVAGELERLAVPPRELALLDSYAPAPKPIDLILPALLGVLAGPGGPPEDQKLIAMAAYMSMFREWEPRELAVPSVVISATEVDAAAIAAAGLGPWPLPHRHLEVKADHFSMVDGKASDTAETLRQMLATASQALTD